MPFAAVLDANVLIPARLRDILLTVAEAGSYVPLWSSEILAEVRRHLPEGMDESAKDALVREMSNAFPDALVTWPHSIELEVRLPINDKDRHVVATALRARADVVVTNDKGLREEIERATDLGIDAQNPDVFLSYAVGARPEGVATALTRMANARWLGDGNLDPEPAVSRVAMWCDRTNLHATAGELRDLARHIGS